MHGETERRGSGESGVFGKGAGSGEIQTPENVKLCWYVGCRNSEDKVDLKRTHCFMLSCLSQNVRNGKENWEGGTRERRSEWRT